MSKKHHPIGIGMTPSRTKLGNFLRDRRLELKLSQIQVTKISGVKQSFYSMLEIGIKRYPSAKKLEGLAKALKCDFSQLQSLASEKRQAKLKPKTDLSKFADRRIKPTNSPLGQLVRARRKELGLNQAQLAGKLRVERQFISQIELGQCHLSNNEVVRRLAKALKLKIIELKALRPPRKLKKIKKDGTEPATVGEFLAFRRVELGLTQKEVASRVETSASTISVIEKGKCPPNSQILNKLKIILGCEIPAEFTSL